jgi:hypothetical protein
MSMLYFAAVAQPRIDWLNNDSDPTRYPKHGTLLKPDEKRDFADRWSSGATKLDAVLDHADMVYVGEDTPPDAVLGSVTDAFIDSRSNLIVVGAANLRRPEVRRMAQELERQQVKWGVSLMTTLNKGTGRKTVPHIGLTRDPVWGPEGSYLEVCSTELPAFRNWVRDNYIADPTMYVPAPTRERYAKTAQQDELDIAKLRDARARRAAYGPSRDLDSVVVGASNSLDSDHLHFSRLPTTKMAETPQQPQQTPPPATPAPVAPPVDAQPKPVSPAQTIQKPREYTGERIAADIERLRKNPNAEQRRIGLTELRTKAMAEARALGDDAFEEAAIHTSQIRKELEKMEKETERVLTEQQQQGLLSSDALQMFKQAAAKRNDPDSSLYVEVVRASVEGYVAAEAKRIENQREYEARLKKEEEMNAQLAAFEKQKKELEERAAKFEQELAVRASNYQKELDAKDAKLKEQEERMSKISPLLAGAAQSAGLSQAAAAKASPAEAEKLVQTAASNVKPSGTRAQQQEEEDDDDVTVSAANVARAIENFGQYADPREKKKRSREFLQPEDFRTRLEHARRSRAATMQAVQMEKVSERVIYDIADGKPVRDGEYMAQLTPLNKLSKYGFGDWRPSQ